VNTRTTDTLLRPFAEIDRLIRGEGYASAAAVARTTRYHDALAVEAPLCLQAATALLERRGGRIVLYTGFVVPELFPQGENDGPLGTVALARALQRTGFSPSVHVDRELVDTTRWLAAELGCEMPIVPIRIDTPPPCDVAIAIEKPGANAEGVLHTFDGRRIEGGSQPIDALFTELSDRGVLTLAVGDVGNELGFGGLSDLVRRLLPDGGRCRCGCGSGIAAAASANLLVPAAVSNWGAYGIAAALAVLAREPQAALLASEEERMLRVAAVRGCRDGVRRRGVYGVDGIVGDLSVRLVESILDLVNAAMT